MSEQEKKTPLLHIENLRVSFKGEDKQYIETVKGISFDIPTNTTVALVGESGSGKSVTSLATMGLLPVGQSKIDEKSKIIFEGKDLLGLSRTEMRKICGKDVAGTDVIIKSGFYGWQSNCRSVVFTYGYEPKTGSATCFRVA